MWLLTMIFKMLYKVGHEGEIKILMEKPEVNMGLAIIGLQVEMEATRKKQKQ